MKTVHCTVVPFSDANRFCAPKHLSWKTADLSGISARVDYISLSNTTQTRFGKSDTVTPSKTDESTPQEDKQKPRNKFFDIGYWLFGITDILMLGIGAGSLYVSHQSYDAALGKPVTQAQKQFTQAADFLQDYQTLHGKDSSFPASIAYETQLEEFVASKGLRYIQHLDQSLHEMGMEKTTTDTLSRFAFLDQTDIDNAIQVFEQAHQEDWDHHQTLDAFGERVLARHTTPERLAAYKTKTHKVLDPLITQENVWEKVSWGAFGISAFCAIVCSGFVLVEKLRNLKNALFGKKLNTTISKNKAPEPPKEAKVTQAASDQTKPQLA